MRPPDLLSCPRLSTKARLRRDTVRGGYMLLSPERGLALNATATEIIKRLDGARTVAEIAAALAAETGRPVAEIEGEVLAFLEELFTRALLEQAE